MKHHLFNIIFILLVTLACCALASAQTSGAANTAGSGQAAQDAPQTGNRTNADETFELNITERRITEHDFTASTTVEAGEETAHGLMLRVGVALSAGEINVLLRNVRGHVRFRASLDRVLERLSARRTPDAVP